MHKAIPKSQSFARLPQASVIETGMYLIQIRDDRWPLHPPQKPSRHPHTDKRADHDSDATASKSNHHGGRPSTRLDGPAKRRGNSLRSATDNGSDKILGDLDMRRSELCEYARPKMETH